MSPSATFISAIVPAAGAAASGESNHFTDAPAVADPSGEVESIAADAVRSRTVHIDVDEGNVAAIKHINIVGNTVFEDEDIIEEFESGIPPFWKFWAADLGVQMVTTDRPRRWHHLIRELDLQPRSFP